MHAELSDAIYLVAKHSIQKVEFEHFSQFGILVEHFIHFILVGTEVSS